MIMLDKSYRHNKYNNDVLALKKAFDSEYNFEINHISRIGRTDFLLESLIKDYKDDFIAYPKIDSEIDDFYYFNKENPHYLIILSDRLIKQPKKESFHEIYYSIMSFDDKLNQKEFNLFNDYTSIDFEYPVPISFIISTSLNTIPFIQICNSIDKLF